MINAEVLHRLADTLEARKAAEPGSSYVASLFHKGQDAILKKIGEEATEAVMASKDNDRLHVVRRPVAAQGRGVLLLNDTREGPGMHERFSEIWVSSEPGVSASTSGL